MTKENEDKKTETPLSQSAVEGLVICAACKFWGDDEYEYDGCRPCSKEGGHFFVGGGDQSDNLYTKPTFGCVDGERK